MWVTWSAHGYVPRDATTRTQAGQSTTFTQEIAASAAGKSFNETVKLAWTGGASQTGVTARTTVGNDCVAPVPASGTLTAGATCNPDGSATITWTLTNNYSRLMWVTWSANGYMPRDATTRTNPHSSKTFTQQVAAPAAGKTIHETIKLAWMDGSAQTGVSASATVGNDCVTPPPPPVCAATDFASPPMWEVTWGYDFEHRNGGAPLFTTLSNGGLTQIDGSPLPTYMTNYENAHGAGSWHWLYVTHNAADRTTTYTFADGTVRTVTVTGTNCTPTIVWATIPPPAPQVTFTHNEVCGQLTLGVASNATVGANWYYGLKATVNGNDLGSVVQKGPGSNTAVLTLPEDSYGGSAVVKVYVHAATEWDLVPAGLNYQSTYPDPGSHVWLITVNTDCAPPVTITANVVATFTQHTCSAPGSMTLTSKHVKWTITTENETRFGPAGVPITNVSPKTWAALYKGSLPENSTTNPRYYGDVTVTAHADPGYVLAAPYSQTFTFAPAPDCAPTAPVQCTSVADGGVSTNVAPNGWTTTGDVEWVAGGIKLSVPGGWATATISRAFGQTIGHVGTAIDFTASPSQYVGIHLRTSQGSITFEKAPGYGSNWWSETDFGVGAGMGYASFASLAEYVSHNPDLVVDTIDVLYTSPVASSTVLTDVTFGCAKYTFDAVPIALATSASASFTNHVCSALGSMTLTGEHVTWDVVSANATAAGPGGTPISGVPSATWPALLDGASPQSVTNAPYFGLVTVTAVPDSGYALAAPYSASFTFTQPSGCPQFALVTLALHDEDPAASGPAGNTVSDLSTLASTGAKVNGLWILFASGLVLLGGVAVGVQQILRRKSH